MYINIYQKFSDELKALCDGYDVQSTWEMWNRKESDRALLCLVTVEIISKCASGEKGKRGVSGRKRELSA